MVEENPECIELELAQVRYDRDQNVLHPFFLKRERQMVVVDDVVAFFRTAHDRDHVAAEILSDLLRLLTSEALALVVHLPHADRHLGRAQAFDRNGLDDRIARIH
jgi:hypothetical protein